MKQLLWFLAGVGVGAVAAHQLARTPQGRALLAEIDDRAEGVASALVDGYRTREAELRDAVSDAGGAVADIASKRP
jgi:hypothetical protein